MLWEDYHNFLLRLSAHISSTNIESDSKADLTGEAI